MYKLKEALPFSQNTALGLPFVFITYGQVTFLSICKIFHSEQRCCMGARDVKPQHKWPGPGRGMVPMDAIDGVLLKW